MSVEKARAEYHYTTGQSTLHWRCTGVYINYANKNMNSVLVGHYLDGTKARSIASSLNYARPFEHALLLSTNKTLD